MTNESVTVCPRCHGSGKVIQVSMTHAPLHDFDRPHFSVREIPCDEKKDPRGCWRVRCQLGKRCIERSAT